MTDEDLSTALHDLGDAYTRVRDGLRAAVGAGKDAAFEAVIRLDDALRAAGPVLSELNELLAAAEPGEAVAAEVENRREAIAEFWARAARQRMRIDRLRKADAELAEIKAEYLRLRDERDDLERVQELAERLPALRETVGRLGEIIERLRGDTDTAERSLEEALSDWIGLSDELQALIQPRIAEVYRRAERQLTALRELIESGRAAEEHLADRQQRFEEVAERHDRALRETEHYVKGLLLYAEADRAMIDALLATGVDTAGAEPELEHVDAALRRCERGLADIDRALKRHLEIRAAIPEIYRLGDGPAR